MLLSLSDALLLLFCLDKQYKISQVVRDKRNHVLCAKESASVVAVLLLLCASVVAVLPLYSLDKTIEDIASGT